MRGSSTRRATAVVLAALLAAHPAGSLLAAPPASSHPAQGIVRGVVTTAGRPLSGVTVALVDVVTGQVHRATSEVSGTFEARVSPGEYVVTTEGRAGLSVGQAPGIIPVTSGQTSSTRIELVSLNLPLAQEPAPPAPGEPAPPAEGTAGAPVITHEPVVCFVAGEFPLLDAKIEPAPSVARARVYFKSALGTSYYFVEMTSVEGLFQGKLPRPRIEASPIEYYIQATTTELADAQTPQVSAKVVEKAEDCEGKVAAAGPAGPVQVFSASTGAALSPAGFAAGGLGIAAGTLALILGGAAAAGIAAAVTVFNPSPTPGPTPTPHPTPTPTPAPTPTPTPTPTPKPSQSPPPVSPFN